MIKDIEKGDKDMQEMYGKTDLEKFVFFIKEFKENISQYKRVVIRIDFPDKHHNSLDYEGKKAIKKYSDEILNTMISLLLKYDVVYCNNDSEEISFIIGDCVTGKQIHVFCFKKTTEGKNDKRH